MPAADCQLPPAAPRYFSLFAKKYSPLHPKVILFAPPQTNKEITQAALPGAVKGG